MYVRRPQQREFWEIALMFPPRTAKYYYLDWEKSIKTTSSIYAVIGEYMKNTSLVSLYFQVKHSCLYYIVALLLLLYLYLNKQSTGSNV